MNLTEFLLARIGEDEAAIRLEIGRRDVSLVGAFAPARLLAECEAKRRIVQVWADPLGHWCAAEADAAARQKRQILQLLALPYADHPDYDPTWPA